MLVGVFNVNLSPGSQRLCWEEALLEKASIEIAEEESLTLDSDSIQDLKPPEVKAEDLKDYLRKLNPEDFGRFTP